MNDYKCIDLHIVKQKIEALTYIKEAKEYILNESVSFNPLIIKDNNLRSKEALKLLNNNFEISFDGINNVNSLLDKANKNICLEGNELKDILVFHNHCQRIKKIISNIEDDLVIKDYADSININQRVFDEIEKCIDSGGAIKDDASKLLKEINEKISRNDKNLYNKAYSFISKYANELQEQNVFLRDNRITFLVKNSFKNKFHGYIYGTSASGLATYVEPDSFIDENNLKLKLIEDKNDEINRILLNLTYLVSTIRDDYILNFDSIIKLEVCFAKAKYGYLNNGIVSLLTEDKYFDFVDVCHPLIDQTKVVCNSYRLFEPYKGIVISGSNTGGKTVSLKCIGLSILMTYLGIPVLASKAIVPFYKNIYVDIDDNQSIADSLSTFSSHITNINNILNNADDKSLILIDELISGTDPKEAQAISLAILDKIKMIKSQFIITTHFDDIKNYSYEDNEIMLSSVGFDMNSLKPTYKYHEDSIGFSNAIDIAQRYIDDKSIIDNARNYIKLNQTKQDELLNKLSIQINENEVLKEKLEQNEKEIEIKLNFYNEKITELENEKENILSKYQTQLDNRLNEIIDLANDKLDKLNDEKDFNSLKQIINEHTSIEDNEEVEFNIGDNVRIKDNEQIGAIIDIKNEKVSVNVKGLTIKTNISNLTLMPKIKKQNKFVEKKRYKRISSEINVIGQHVEEALVQIEEYLDKANAANMKQVKIIHGIGTGSLRQAIRNKLKHLSYVKEFKDGDYYDGGSAVTLVEFK